MKLCHFCNILQDFTMFHKDKKTKDGFDYYCKKCSYDKLLAWKQNNKEAYIKSKHQHYINNKEYYLQQAKLYREKNKDIIKQKKKEYNRLNKIILFEKRTNPIVRFNNAKRAAKIKNIPWNLSINEYLSFIEKPCYYCNDKLAAVSNSTGIGLDRINNCKLLGYRIDNVVTCCKLCNKIKNNFLTKDETVVAISAILLLRETQSMNNVKK